MNGLPIPRASVVAFLALGCGQGLASKVQASSPGSEPPVDADFDGHSADEDCDDSDALVHPGADESCNGVDDDCDGAIDNGPVGYIDEDHDGFGATGGWTSWCDVPRGAALAEEPGDCDDRDAERHPAAADPMCDGIDQDCDGIAGAMELSDGRLFDHAVEALELAEDGQSLFLCPGRHQSQSRVIGGKSVSIFGLSDEPGGVVLDGGGIGTILYVGEGSSIHIESVDLENGVGQPWTTEEDLGGAIYVDRGSLFLSNCALRNNSSGNPEQAGYGGAIAINTDPVRTGGTGRVEVRDCLFEGNYATSSGGAIHTLGYDFGLGFISIESSTFLANSAGDSGGAVNVGSHGEWVFSASDTRFEQNVAGNSGAAVSFGGYGPYEVSIASSSFVAGSAGSSGGALDIGGYGSGYLVLSGTEFSNNIAENDGGAIDVGGSGVVDLEIDDLFLSHNAAGNNGGALSVPVPSLSSHSPTPSSLATHQAMKVGQSLCQQTETNSTYESQIRWLKRIPRR